MPSSVIVEGKNIRALDSKFSGFFSTIVVWTDNESKAKDHAIGKVKKSWKKKHSIYALNDQADYTIEEVVPISIFVYFHTVVFNFWVLKNVHSFPHKNLIIY